MQINFKISILIISILCLNTLSVKSSEVCKNATSTCATDSQCCSNKCDMLSCGAYSKNCKSGGLSCMTDRYIISKLQIINPH